MKYLFALILFLPTLCNGATLHAILAIDTLAGESEDPMLCNQLNWNRFLKVVAKETGMNLNQINIFGENLTWREFVQAVASLQVESDDTLLFYTASHGNRPYDKIAPWPHVGWSCESTSFDLQLVIDLLKPFDARLTLIIAECCNSFVTPMGATFSLTDRAPSSITQENYKKLFLGTEGLLITTSSSPGEKSWARPGLGSDYTTILLYTLEQEVKKAAGTDWLQVFKRAVSRTKQRDPDQHPIYEISNQ